MLTEMKVQGITIDPLTKEPILVLRDASTDNILPVWIGVLEARAIAAEMENIRFSRPMTHDLIRNILTDVRVSVEKIEVTDLAEGVYYASIHMDTSGGHVVVDSRPSDAIALALRMSAPIYVESKLLRKAGKGGEEGKEYLDAIERLAPSEYGKYKM